MPLELIQEYHNFIFPTYYGQKTYREAAFPEDAPSNTLIRIPGEKLADHLRIFILRSPSFSTQTTFLHASLLHLGGTVKMGRDHHGQDLYGWDNEFGSEIKVEF